MSMDIIVALPLITGFGLFWWGSQLPDDLNLMKLMFQLAFLPLVFLSVHLAVMDVTLNYAASAETIDTLGQFTEILGWLLFLIGLFLLWRVVMVIKDWFVQRKKNREEELYG